MIKSILICLLIDLAIIGCSVQKQILRPDKKPELISREQLPPYKGKNNYKNFLLKTKLLISETGVVEKVDLLNSSGDHNWDTMAISQIKKWSYSPAIFNEQPVKIWLNQAIQVHILDNLELQLFEIVVNTSEKADSLYSTLSSNGDFINSVKNFSISESKFKNGFIDVSDFNKYPKDVQLTLFDLKINETTKPIKIDSMYYIFKKMKNK